MTFAGTRLGFGPRRERGAWSTTRTIARWRGGRRRGKSLRERYVYVGYTCVQVLNGDKNNALVKEFAWDPTEPTATRPLTFRHAEKSLMLFYAFDGNKNVSDLFFFALQNGIGAHYEYAPFGAVTRTAKATGSKVDLIGANPWRFSSEFYDSELDLVYYNYRHYSPALGRWLRPHRGTRRTQPLRLRRERSDIIC